jgi:hypothetical protein
MKREEVIILFKISFTLAVIQTIIQLLIVR